MNPEYTFGGQCLDKLTAFFQPKSDIMCHHDILSTGILGTWALLFIHSSNGIASVQSIILSRFQSHHLKAGGEVDWKSHTVPKLNTVWVQLCKVHRYNCIFQSSHISFPLDLSKMTWVTKSLPRKWKHQWKEEHELAIPLQSLTRRTKASWKEVMKLHTSGGAFLTILKALAGQHKTKCLFEQLYNYLAS